MPASYWKDLLRRHGIRPSHRLGQNFLVDPNGLELVVRAAGLTGVETVLEIGAGLGALTRLLLERANRVVAIEVDRRLDLAFREAVGEPPKLTYLAGDFLRLDWGSSVEEPFAVVANIPYLLTSHLLRRLLGQPPRPSRIVLTLQREVVERILSGPGEMSLLALSVQLYGTPESVGRLDPAAFLPAPKVESEILRIDVHPNPRVPPGLIEPLFRAAKAGFGQRRKMLRNALAAGLRAPAPQVEAWLDRAQIKPDRRAQELSVEEWGRLAQILDSAQELLPADSGRRSRGERPR